MSRPIHHVVCCTGIGLCLALAACRDGDAAQTAAQTTADAAIDASGTDAGAGATDAGSREQLELRIEARVRDKPLRCGDTYLLGTGPTAARLVDLRFFVSDVRAFDSFLDERPDRVLDDGDFAAHQIALLDFEDGTAGWDGDEARRSSRSWASTPRARACIARQTRSASSRADR